MDKQVKKQIEVIDTVVAYLLDKGSTIQNDPRMAGHAKAFAAAIRECQMEKETLTKEGKIFFWYFMNEITARKVAKK
jgi:hypothetical protein